MSLVLTWDDGTTDRLSAATLRDACPCASCINAATPVPPRNPDSVRIDDVKIVGSYAVNLTFSPDSHAAGIYTYALLRELGEQG